MEKTNTKILPKPAVGVILYISLALGNWYYLRQFMAYMGAVYFTGVVGMVFTNLIIAMLLGGLVFYGILSMLITRAANPRSIPHSNTAMVQYVLKLSFAAANLVYGGLSFIYIAFPLIGFYGDLILRFVVLTLCVVFAYLYCSHKGYFPKQMRARALYSMGSTYLISYIVIVGLKTLMYYMVGVI